MTIANLPNDLEWEILARVPAKSLQALKTTCKGWYALFKDPKFVEKNKKMSKGERESMLLSNHEVYSIAGDLHNNTGDVEQPPLKLTGKLSKDLDLYAMYHCDGLILCEARDKSRLVVWNPCTGQMKSIEPRKSYSNEDIFALGYSSSSSSCRCYKILRCCYHQNEQRVMVSESEIYELSSDSWRVFDSSLSIDDTYGCTSLKGDSYWVAINEGNCRLMKFDFTTDAFVSLPLPFKSEGFEDTVLLSVVRDEKLAVSHTPFCEDVMRIWITNKIDEKDSWSSFFVLKFQVDYYKYDVRMENFLLNEENKVAVCCGKYQDDNRCWTMIHIFREDMYNLVYQDTANPSYYNTPLVITYVPSLFRIH
ncbi:hypothetical protein N665_0387s0010 [Sinapis alba]|nr:hypothetical protein N665_0387s0010 [Sinapis alba]